MPKHKFPAKVHDAVWERCGGYCEKCGLPLQDNNWHWHHRLLKSQGGKDSVTNGIAVHWQCHSIIHTNPMQAYEYGYMVPMGNNPAEWRLTLPNGRSVRLSEDGHYDYLNDDEKEGA